MIVPINLEWMDRKVEFCMDLDTNCPTDFAVMHYVTQGIPCEPESCFVMLRALKEGDIAVDAGANIGFFTLFMSKLVGATGHVVAFEPDQRNLEKLHANLALNKCENVDVVEKPLWSSRSDVNLFLYADAGANSLWPINGSDKSAPMPATTLDWECDKVRLIKMDIEGAEVRALRGARDILKHKPVLVVEMNEAALERAGTSFAELREVMKGFDCFILSESGHFPTFIPRHMKVTAVKQNTNVMFSTLAEVSKIWGEVQA